MTPPRKILIIGASHAGVAMAAALRDGGFDGAIAMAGREAGLPVSRPPLSKAWLADGGDAADEAGGGKPLLRGEDWYADNAITLMPETEITAIDRHAHTATDAHAGMVEWDVLVLATGGRARRYPAAAGAALPPIHTLRTADDATRLKSALENTGHLAVIGGGYIGLEVAATARGRGIEVTVLEAAPRLLARVASPELSAHVESLHKAHGLRLITGAAVAGIEAAGRTGARIRLAAGEAIACDCVLAGIGMLPDTALAESAGLLCDDGIMVDACYRAADKSGTPQADIFAIGDVARYCVRENVARYGTSARIESVHHANTSAEIAAATILGKPLPQAEMPWFWSDQYAEKIRSVGLVPAPAGDVEAITRPGKRDDAISFWTFAGGGLVAVEAVSDPAAFMIASRVFNENRTPPRPEQIASPGFDLKSLLR